MDPQHRLFLQSVWEAVESSGYDPLSWAGRNVGVFAGVQFQEYQDLIQEAGISDPYSATGNSHAMLANRVSYLMDWHGPSEAIDTACSSALVAINRAIQAIKTQECEIAIAGGVSLALSPKTYIATSQLGVLSPTGRCKTFDAKADGYVKGEGVGAFVLKPLEKAKADGDSILAIIRGSGVKHGGKAQSLTAPNAFIQSELLQDAYSKADIPIETVSYMETHGTGTPLGDPAEIEGLKRAFQKLAKDNILPEASCALGSVKTNIGQLEPAAGVAGLFKVILALRHRTLPGNVHFEKQNPHIQLAGSPFYILKHTRPWDAQKDAQGRMIPRRAGVSSFGLVGRMRM